MSNVHERFGREWEEKWQQHSNGGLFPYPEEYYLLVRREVYEDGCHWKGKLDHWEHDGFGYVVSMQQNMGQGEWSLSRTSLTDYRSIGYRFWSKQQMDEHIKREGWREYEQLTLELEVEA